MSPEPVSAPDYTKSIVIVDPDSVWGTRSTIGLAEQAARLGAPSVYERRGTLIFQDTFSCGLASWAIAGSGTGRTMTLACDRSEFGGYSALLETGTGASPYSQIHHSQPWLGAWSRMGLEAHISSNAATKFLRVRVTIYDGTFSGAYELEISYNTYNVYVMTAGPAWTTVANIGLISMGDTLFNAIKLVIDPENHQYVRAYINHDEIDLSAYAPHLAPLADRAPCSLRIGGEGDGTTSGKVWIDRVIFTEGEPAE